MRLQWSRGCLTQPNVCSRCSLRHNFDSIWHSKGQEEVTTVLCRKANSQFKENKKEKLLMEQILFLCHTGLLKWPVTMKILTLKLHILTNHLLSILNHYTQKWIIDHTAHLSYPLYHLCPSGRVCWIRHTSRVTVAVNCRRLTLLWDVIAARFRVVHVFICVILALTAGQSLEITQFLRKQHFTTFFCITHAT